MRRKDLFKHDCPPCIFLGCYGILDTYWHPDEIGGTVFARYGDEPQDQACLPVVKALSGEYPDALKDAEHLACVYAAQQLLAKGVLKISLGVKKTTKQLASIIPPCLPLSKTPE